MPIYCYRCTKCNRVIEKVTSYKNKKKTVSCSCGGVAVSIICNVSIIVPYEMKSIKPYRPEVMDPQNEMRYACEKKGLNPKDYLDE